MGNNPISYVDPDGGAIIITGLLIAAAVAYLASKYGDVYGINDGDQTLDGFINEHESKGRTVYVYGDFAYAIY